MDAFNQQFQKQQQELKESLRGILETNRRKEERADALLEAAQETAINTRSLSDIVSLIQKGNEKQDEIFDLFIEILAVSKAKNIEEAESMYRKVINRISTYTGDMETTQKLIGFATSIYKKVEGLF